MTSAQSRFVNLAWTIEAIHLVALYVCMYSTYPHNYGDVSGPNARAGIQAQTANPKKEVKQDRSDE